MPPPVDITTSPAIPVVVPFPVPERTAPDFTLIVLLPTAPVTTKVPELIFVAPVYVLVPLSVMVLAPSLLTAMPPLIGFARVKFVVLLKPTVVPATPLMLLAIDPVGRRCPLAACRRRPLS